MTPLTDPPAGRDRSIVRRLRDLRVTELNTCFDAEDKVLWCLMQPRQRPCFTPKLLEDIATLQRLITAASTATAPAIDYLILGSAVPGVFNLGGDLALFVNTIRSGDRAALQRYARACVAVGHANYRSYNDKVTTIALLEGDALGGGFECALSCDILIAERHVKFSLPEIIFNLFPGMGAYSFLSRRVGAYQAETIIRSGRSYSAQDMHDLGVIDAVVDSHTARQEIAALIAARRHNKGTMRALHQIRRRVNGVSLAEMNDITDLWVDTAMGLTDRDLRKMSHIAAAQDRLRTRAIPSAPAGQDGLPAPAALIPAS
ncbi:crotonase/enoyl-CoA hydratase family protein [Acidiphilium sp.]|uniref:crotonase/enoyl-CoA hydratase family protein n=1 Tax=Acidiphilium sp. TaxID=527 RepID=UPI003D02F156